MTYYGVDVDNIGTGTVEWMKKFMKHEDGKELVVLHETREESFSNENAKDAYQYVRKHNVGWNDVRLHDNKFHITHRISRIRDSHENEFVCTDGVLTSIKVKVDSMRCDENGKIVFPNTITTLTIKDNVPIDHLVLPAYLIYLGFDHSFNQPINGLNFEDLRNLTTLQFESFCRCSPHFKGSISCLSRLPRKLEHFYFQVLIDCSNRQFINRKYMEPGRSVVAHDNSYDFVRGRSSGWYTVH